MTMEIMLVSMPLRRVAISSIIKVPFPPVVIGGTCH
jgi:hypothetical protein